MNEKTYLAQKGFHSVDEILGEMSTHIASIILRAVLLERNTYVHYPIHGKAFTFLNDSAGNLLGAIGYRELDEQQYRRIELCDQGSRLQ